MFLVDGTRRWKKKNAIFLRETRTFTGNFIVSRPATDILIRLEIERSFIQLSNDILIGWKPCNILLPDPKCRPPRIPYLRPAPSRVQSNNVGICDRESGSGCPAI